MRINGDKIKSIDIQNCQLDRWGCFADDRKLSFGGEKLKNNYLNINVTLTPNRICEITGMHKG